jgi:uncharacterized HAD superfamily protein
MSGRRLKVGVDCDEPLADFNAHLQPWHNRHYGTDISVEDVHTFKLWEVWGCSREESNRRILRFYKSPAFNRITPTPGSVDGVAEAAKQNDLVVVTSRVGPAVPRTQPFIDEHYPNKFQEIYFSSNYALAGEAAKSKGEVCADLGLDVVIDDCLDYAFDIIKKDIPVLLFDRPWNRESAYPPGMKVLPNGISRVKTWEEIVKIVNNGLHT